MQSACDADRHELTSYSWCCCYCCQHD